MDELEQPPGESYWTIVKHEGSKMEELTLNSDSLSNGSKVLPIFGSGDEAAQFLEDRALGRGWRLRQTGAGELVSVLLGPRNDVGHIAFYPLSEENCFEAPELMRRQGFMDFLLGRRLASSLL